MSIVNTSISWSIISSSYQINVSCGVLENDTTLENELEDIKRQRRKTRGEELCLAQLIVGSLKSRIRNLKSEIWNPESGIQNPKSKKPHWKLELVWNLQLTIRKIVLLRNIEQTNRCCKLLNQLTLESCFFNNNKSDNSFDSRQPIVSLLALFALIYYVQTQIIICLHFFSNLRESLNNVQVLAKLATPKESNNNAILNGATRT